jgi:hypothetical protein
MLRCDNIKTRSKESPIQRTRSVIYFPPSKITKAGSKTYAAPLKDNQSRWVICMGPDASTTHPTPVISVVRIKGNCRAPLTELIVVAAEALASSPSNMACSWLASRITTDLATEARVRRLV